MYNIRQAWKIAAQNFSGWLRSPRVWMTFALAFVLCLMLSEQIVSHARQYETTLQIAEPFIWTYGDADSIMLSSLLLILLFADMPFVNPATPYRLIRTKRSVWLAGQLIYVILATGIYNLFIVFVLGITTVPFAYVGNVWSKNAAMLGYGGGESVTVPVSIKTMESSTPYQCAVSVFLLMLLYTLFIALLMLALNLLIGHSAGVPGAFAMNLYGFLLNPAIFQKLFHFTGNLAYRANVLCGWLSPLNHATFSMHDFGYDYLPTIRVSAAIFGVMILVFIFTAYIRMKRYNFSFTQVNE